MAGDLQVAASVPPENLPVSGSHGSFPSLLLNDVAVVLAVSAVLAGLLALAAWLGHRFSRCRAAPDSSSIGGSQRRRRLKRNPTLAEIGGLPPLRRGSSEPPDRHADQ